MSRWAGTLSKKYLILAHNKTAFDSTAAPFALSMVDACSQQELLRVVEYHWTISYCMSGLLQACHTRGQHGYLLAGQHPR